MVLAAGFSVTAWLLQYLRRNIQCLVESYLPYLGVYFLIGGAVSFAVCYYKGPVTNPRLLDLIKWLIQLLAVLLIYNSSYIPELSVTIFICTVITVYLLHYLSIAKSITRLW